MIGRNYHIQDYLRILCKFIYVSNGKFLNWVCLSILILGVFRTKQEMNWLNWMPSGGTVVIVQDDNTKTGIKGVVYIKKESLSDIITTVYPQFASFSEDGKDRALTFIAKMNPHVQTTGSADGSGDVSYVAKKGEMLLIPLYKFISE